MGGGIEELRLIASCEMRTRKRLGGRLRGRYDKMMDMV